MTGVGRAARVWLNGLTACSVAGCGWESLDAVVGPSGAPVALDAAMGSGTVDASADALPAPPPSGACTAAGPFADQWTFDAGVQGWALLLDPNVDASLSWAAASGDPSPGALQVDVTPAPSDAGTISGAWLQLDQNLGDATDKTLSAWVWLDVGTAPHLKAFAQTGSQWVWADNGTVYLSPHVWTCVSLPFSAPSYQQASYDPTHVIRIGFEMLGRDPFRLYVDSIRVR